MNITTTIMTMLIAITLLGPCNFGEKMKVRLTRDIVEANLKIGDIIEVQPNGTLVSFEYIDIFDSKLVTCCLSPEEYE